MYNFLLKKDGYDIEDYSYLLFYYVDGISRNGSIRFKGELVKVNLKNEEETFKKAVELIKKGKIPEEKCGWCGVLEKQVTGSKL